MRSPSKLRPSPGELERKLQEETFRRRKERIVQARSQSLSRGREVAQNSNALAGKESLKEWEIASRDRLNEKLMRLETLETRRDELLKNFGSGRESALKEIELGNAKAVVVKSNLRAAKERGASALEEEMNNRRMNELMSNKRSDMKKTALFNEKVRSRRLLLKKTPNFQEIHASKGLVSSKSVPRSEFVGSDKENVRVIRNSLSHSEEDGFTQALSEPPPSAPICPTRESLHLRKLKQEAALKIKKAKEDFMNINESIPEEGGSPLIHAKILRENPTNLPHNAEIRTNKPVELERKDDASPEVRRQNSRSFEPSKPAMKVITSSSRDILSDSTISSVPSTSSSSEVHVVTPEKGPSRIGVRVNVLETSSSLAGDSSTASISSTTMNDSSFYKPEASDKLKDYIYKCINMRRDELDELSSLTTSSLLENVSSSTSMNTTPPASILSKSKKKKSPHRSEKSVRFSSSMSSSTEDDELVKKTLDKLLPSISSLSLDFLSEGILSSSDISKEVHSSSPKIDSLKDKIFNMEMPLLQRPLKRPDKLESSSTFISSSIFLSTDEKVSQIESFDARGALSSSSAQSSSC